MMRIGKEHLQNKQFEEAAKVFCEAAISFRLAAYARQIDAEETSARARIASESQSIYAEWLARRKDLVLTRPSYYPPVTTKTVQDIVLFQFFDNPEVEHVLRFLEIHLSQCGVEFFSPGGSLQRYVVRLLALRIKANDASSHTSPNDSKFLDEMDICVALDVLADRLVLILQSGVSNPLQDAGVS